MLHVRTVLNDVERGTGSRLFPDRFPMIFDSIRLLMLLILRLTLGSRSHAPAPYDKMEHMHIRDVETDLQTDELIHGPLYVQCMYTMHVQIVVE